MSKFDSFQKVSIEELRSETPIGNIPRKYELFVKGSQVRHCTPGDLIEVHGIFLSQEITNQFFNDSLIQDTFIMAQKISKIKENYEKINNESNGKFITDVQEEKNIV